jgi:hypothetical protein
MRYLDLSLLMLEVTSKLIDMAFLLWPYWTLL